MKIILIRHAKSSHNKDNIFAGCKLDTGLTEEGRQEAKKLAAKIMSKFCFENIICSNLKRSYQTGEIFRNEHRKVHKGEIEIDKSELLREVDVGVLSGLKPEVALKKFPKEYENINSGKIDAWIFDQGETPELLKQRFFKLREFLKNYQGRNLLLIGHAMFNRYIAEEWGEGSGVEFGHDCFLELTIVGGKI